MELREGDLTLSEDARYACALREVHTAGWLDLVSNPVSDMPLLEAVRTVRGGLLRASLKYERPSRTIRQIWLSGDTAMASRALADLEAMLRDCPIERLPGRVERFFAGNAGCAAGTEPRDFVTVVRLAIGEPLAA
jgi:lipoate-protein ligase A